MSIQEKNLQVYLGSIVLAIYLIISVPVFAFAILICTAFSFSIRYRISTCWSAILLWLCKTFCKLDHKIEGLENLPKDQAYIVLSKHQSAWETIAFRMILPNHTFVLQRSLTWIPFFGWALATMKPISINRADQTNALRALVKQGKERLSEGMVVIIFPEGTRTAPGEIKKFNAGGALLAQQTGSPVIPIAHNAGKFWPRYSFFKYPGTITVKIGPAIETQGIKAKEINSMTENWIKQAMSEIEDSE